MRKYCLRSSLVVLLVLGGCASARRAETITIPVPLASPVHESSAGNGALIGAGLGLLGGAVLGAFDCFVNEVTGYRCEGSVVLSSAAVGAVVGAGIGFLIGVIWDASAEQSEEK